jgi:hypothetical protein
LITLKICHKTTYRFHTAVSLGPRRLMLRPRESRDLRLISSNVTVTPAAVVTWAHDAFGNAVATATFQGMSTHILIDSVAELQLDAVAWPVFDIAASAIFYLFGDEWTDLRALTIPQYPDAAGRLRSWSQRFVRSNPTDTLALLKDMNAGISEAIRYLAIWMKEQAASRITPARWPMKTCPPKSCTYASAARALGFLESRTGASYSTAGRRPTHLPPITA